IDNDGDADVLVTVSNGAPRLFVNQAHPVNPSSAGRWLGIRALDRHGRDALGASLEVPSAQAPKLRRRIGAGSFLSAHDPRVLFGLGDGDGGPVDVDVTWPDGEVERFRDLDVGEYHLVRQGNGGQSEGRQSEGRQGDSP
ncbi:MAG: ASPIC/UnbV domain-containing protein, partial [Acidobacteriota bacterium]